MSKPSDFATKFPYKSVTGKTEDGTLALNIMKAMVFMGNEWSPITWEDYVKAWKEKGFDSCEKEHACFDRVNKYCKSEDTARLFSPVWEEVNETQ